MKEEKTGPATMPVPAAVTPKPAQPRRRPNPVVYFSVRLPQTLGRYFDDQAKQLGISRHFFLRCVIDAGLERAITLLANGG